MKISSAFTAYVADKRLEGYSKCTLDSYRIQTNLLIRYFGDVDIEDLTYQDFKKYLADQEHLKPSSIEHRMKYLKSLFRWASDEGHVASNPASKLKFPKQGKRIPKALNEENVEMLKIGCRTPLEHAIIDFMYSTGCRIGEIVPLNRNSIDWENNSVIVVGKGDKERETPFSIRCAIWLRKYLSIRTDDDPALFVTERVPHRMSIAQMRYIVKRIAKNANMETNVYPHRLRHTFATHLLDNGAPIEAIQRFLGHARLDTTMVYAHLSGQRIREIHRKYF